MKRKICTFILALFLVFIVNNNSEAKTIWSDGPNKVSNSEIAQFVYSGNMTLYPYHKMANGRYAYKGWIKYTSGDSLREAFQETKSSTNSGAQIANLTFRDNLCLRCPPTKFSFDFNTRTTSSISTYATTTDFNEDINENSSYTCLLYTSPSPRDS